MTSHGVGGALSLLHRGNQFFPAAVPSDIGKAGTWGRCVGHGSAQMQPCWSDRDRSYYGGGPHELGLQGGREVGGG